MDGHRKVESDGLRRSLLICVILSAACAPLVRHSVPARTPDAPPKPPVERAKFRLFKYQGAVGEEVAELTRSGDSLSLKSKLKLSHLGGEVVLDATLAARRDLTPVRFEVQGATSTQSQIDAAVEINQGAATVREGGTARSVEAPAAFFTATGYAPVAV